MKKIRRYIAPRFLAMGASLTIGLLSFGGILALMSGFSLALSLPLALAGFVLSTAYEGEIYLQNIKRALKKLFKRNHLERQIAKDYLLDQMLTNLKADAPYFFKDYQAALQSKHPNKKKLSDMEKWFALQLFSDQPSSTAYQANLKEWLQSKTPEWQVKRDWMLSNTRFVPLFSLVAGVFMGLGTTYLLMDAFLTIPMLAALPVAALPVLIVPMAVVAGAAYGFLIYNATTDMIANHTIQNWFDKIKADLSQGKYAMAAVFVFMLVLSVALSLCTAGTWWTVAKTTPPLFAWMGQMPSWIMLRLNPLLSSASTFIFNAQNISETLTMVEEMSEAEPSIEEPAVRDENVWQRYNPFQWFIRLTFEPLRSLLFVGHLTSVSAVADRVPGVSVLISAGLGFVNELFEDAHYFFGKQRHQHKTDLPSRIEERRNAGQGHDHEDDLPTQMLRMIFHVLYVPAALWDWGFSDARQNLDFWAALKRQRGLQKNEACSSDHVSCDNQSMPHLDSSWAFEQAVYRIERHKEKKLHDVWFCQDDVLEERAALTALQTTLRKAGAKQRDAAQFCVPIGPRPSVHSLVSKHLSTHKMTYNKQRFFGPDTLTVLNQLPERVAQMASC